MHQMHTIVFNSLEFKPLRKILEGYNVSPLPKSKDEARAKILELLDLSVIVEGDFIRWIERFYREGNKHVFIYDMEEDVVDDLVKPQAIETLLARYDIEHRRQNFTDTDKPLAPTLIHYEIKADNDGKAQQLEFGYVQIAYLRIVDDETDQINWHPINYYVLVEVDLVHKQILVRLEPTKHLRKLGNDVVRLSGIADKYKQIVSGILNLRTVNSQLILQRALYKIWLESTTIDDPEVFAQLATIETINQAYIENLAHTLELTPKQVELLGNELKTLIEGHLLYEKEYEDANKPGYVRKQKTTDRSGGIFQGVAKSSIEKTELHFKTRAYINSIGKVDRLDYAWYQCGDEIKTNIESNEDFCEVTFFGYTTEEEIDYVLSRIRNYCQQVRDQ